MLFSREKGINAETRYLDLMNQWLILKQQNINIADYLIEKGYFKIIIYGMGIYGRHLVRELENSGLSIIQGIDLKKMDPYHGVRICRLDSISSQADVVVNTIIYDEKVAIELGKYVSCPILSLEQLIFESYR